MLARLFRRPILGPAAAVSRTRGVDEFFDIGLGKKDDDKPPIIGRSWKAAELRLKGFSDLHKLWYVLLKEKNLLATTKEIMKSQGQRYTEQHRMIKVRKSMCRIKQVLTERALAEPDLGKQQAYRKMINDM